MTSVIEEMQEYIRTYRESLGIYTECVSAEELSVLKGYPIKSPKENEQDYKRGWAKLSKAQKLNRLMDYHKRLTASYGLDKQSQHQLKELFYNGVYDCNSVAYNSNEGSVVTIDGLKRDSNGLFYMDPVTVSVAASDLPKTKLLRFAPATTEQLNSANKKLKPIVQIRNCHGS